MSERECDMTPWTLTRWADQKTSPWKNGGGVTTQLAAHPSDAGIDDFEWRVSVAQVDGPNDFSTFPGVDRIIVLLEGRRMALTVDGAQMSLTRNVPFEFRGESTVSCAIPNGSTRDLNVMTRRARARARLTVCVAGDPPRNVPNTAISLIIALDEGLRMSTPGAPHLHRYDVVQVPPGADQLDVEGSGHYAFVEIEPVTNN